MIWRALLPINPRYRTQVVTQRALYEGREDALQLVGNLLAREVYCADDMIERVFRHIACAKIARARIVKEMILEGQAVFVGHLPISGDGRSLRHYELDQLILRIVAIGRSLDILRV